MLDLKPRGNSESTQRLLFATTDRFDFGSTEFDRLFRNASASAFQHPDWLSAFYRHIAPAHDADPLVVTGRDTNGELQLVVALVRRRSGDQAGSIEHAFLGVTDYACPIVANGIDLGADTSLSFHGVLGSHAGLRIWPVHQDHLHQWRLLLGISPLALDFGAHAVRYGFPYAEWRGTNLGSRHAAGLDRKARRLAEASGLRLELVGPDDARRAMLAARDFRTGRFPDDPLQTAHGLEFYTEVATNGARSGLARTYRLASKDGPVAYVLGLHPARLRLRQLRPVFSGPPCARPCHGSLGCRQRQGLRLHHRRRTVQGRLRRHPRHHARVPIGGYDPAPIRIRS